MSTYVQCLACDREIVVRDDLRVSGHGRRGEKCPGSYEKADLTTSLWKDPVR